MKHQVEITYNGRHYCVESKKMLLRTLSKEYDLEDLDYIAFNVWSNRLKNEISFEDKVALYLDIKRNAKKLKEYKK